MSVKVNEMERTTMMKSAYTSSDLYCQNILSMLYDEKALKLSDVSIFKENKEIKTHKAILSSSSNYFKKLFDESPHVEKIEMQQPWIIVQQIVTFLYGGPLDFDLDPLTILEVFQEAKKLEIAIVSKWDINDLILSKINIHNALEVFSNVDTLSDNYLFKRVSRFIANNLKNITSQTDWSQVIRKLKKVHLINIIGEAASSYVDFSNVENLLNFVLEWSGYDNFCDLLKNSKKWNWKSKSLGSKVNECTIDSWGELEQGKQIRKSVMGNNFTWWIEVEKDGPGRFKIIFDSASISANTHDPLCLAKFPASIFSFEALTPEKQHTMANPVFICFSQDASVHWATNFGINLDIGEGSSSNLPIKLNVIENPLVSLILYYFSCDLSDKISSEDIMNRLPHVEYRCLSSYFLCNDEVKKSLKSIHYKI